MNAYTLGLGIAVAFFAVKTSVAQNAPNGIIQTGPNAHGTVINNLEVPTREEGNQVKFPLGSYKNTCDSCRFDGRFLSCQCRTSDGRWPTSQMDWGGTCSNQEVSNHEGALVCAPR